MSDLYSQKKNKLILHPSGSESFGTIPELRSYGIRRGEIYLRVGEHRGAHKGFGILHIWEAHQSDLVKYGCVSIDQVAQHIANMVVHKAQIFCEFQRVGHDNRLTVMKTPKGLLVLEPRDDRRGFGYYVVTWYPKRTASGTLVGQVIGKVNSDNNK